MKTKILALSVLLSLFAVVPAFAQVAATATSTTNGQVDAAVAADESITASDLGVSDPTLLPDSPFYFLKSWSRAIQSALTFNKVKKAELRAQFANEKLIEAKKIAEKTQDPAMLEKALKNYKDEVDNVKEVAGTLSSSDPAADQLLNKLTDFQIKRQKLMDRLAAELPAQAREQVVQAQEHALEKFSEIVGNEDPEKIKERVEKALDEQEGSQFKNFKNLEVLLKLEEKLPEQAKAAIQQAQENALKRLQGDLSGMSPEDQARFKAYLDKIGGDELNQAEIMNRLEKEGLAKGLLEKIKSSREEIVNKVEERLKNIQDDAARQDYLNKIREEKLQREEGGLNEHNGDIESLLRKRMELRTTEQQRIDDHPETTEVCTEEWEPVCGADGTTYSNECKAKAASTTIASEGPCANGAITPKPLPVTEIQNKLDEYYKKLRERELEQAKVRLEMEKELNKTAD